MFRMLSATHVAKETPRHPCARGAEVLAAFGEHHALEKFKTSLVVVVVVFVVVLKEHSKRKEHHKPGERE